MKDVAHPSIKALASVACQASDDCGGYWKPTNDQVALLPKGTGFDDVIGQPDARMKICDGKNRARYVPVKQEHVKAMEIRAKALGFTEKVDYKFGNFSFTKYYMRINQTTLATVRAKCMEMGGWRVPTRSLLFEWTESVLDGHGCHQRICPLGTDQISN